MNLIVWVLIIILYIIIEDNEGHSMLLCGNKLVHIVHELQRAYKPPTANKRYQLTIFSNTEDHKRDKRLDYVFYKLKNKRCLAIVELKLNVGVALSAQ